jgi:hypothetical protein
LKKQFYGVGYNQSLADSGRHKQAFKQQDLVRMTDEIKKNMGDPAHSDMSYVIEGPNSGLDLLRPSNHFKFAIVPKKAYGELRPWWISMLSLSTLMNKIENVPVRYEAGPCPYSPETTREHIGDLYTELKTQATEQGSIENGLYYILPQHLEVGRSDNLASSDDVGFHWLFRFEKRLSEAWWAIATAGNGDYVMQKTVVTDNTALLLAVLVSSFVALMCGVMGAYLAYVGVSALCQSFGSAGWHIERYDDALGAAGASDAKQETANRAQGHPSSQPLSRTKTLPERRAVSSSKVHPE